MIVCQFQVNDLLCVNDKGRFIRAQTAQWRCLLQQRQFGRGPGFWVTTERFSSYSSWLFLVTFGG